MNRAATRQQHRAATLDDPRFESLRVPATRRRLAISVLVLLALQAGIIAAAEWVHFAVVASVLAVLVIATIFTLGALKGSTRGVEELSPELLDERQVQVRGRVYATAYKALGAVVAIGLAVAFVWDAAAWPAPPGSVLIAAGVTVWVLVFALPAVVAGLTAKV